MNEITRETARRVVVGVDGSENSARAAVWAAREAASRHVPLTVVHALHLPDGAALAVEPVEHAKRRRAEGGRLLDLAARSLRDGFPDLEITTELSELSAARTLSALSLRSALVVTGTRGHGGFAGMLLGSVSRRLAAHAHSPLVVVRGGEPEDQREEVVLGIEPGQPADAIRYAFAAAQRHGALLHAVRVWWPHSTYTGPMGIDFADFEQIRTQEGEAVEHLIEPFRAAFPDVKVEITAVNGNPVPVLIETARGARLLVIGTHRHYGPLSVGAGYVAEGLLAHSPTPVAVVPTHEH